MTARSVPPGKVLPFQRKPATLPPVPSLDEAESIVERLGPVEALRVAEYILLTALFSEKEARFGGRAVPVLLASSAIDISAAVRNVGDLFALVARDPKAFARADRIYRKQLKAGAKVKREAKGADSAPLQNRTGISGAGSEGGAA